MLENKHYSWVEVEDYVLRNIAESNYYATQDSTKIPYSIIMPPPNVTGYLHMGHALVTTLQDVLIRYKRMKGFDTLWQPGVDHAGIATQVVVEKRLAEQGIKRIELGRETFIEKVYEWKEHSAGRIIEQIKKMGASADFSYLAFTMDSQSQRGVYHAFKTLYDDGLIYQDYKLVNWDTQLQTAISDLEVENKEVKGKMYYLKYYIDNTDSYISVATTRPETIFGDTAIAVNEQDPRYANLIGKEVIIPVVGRKIKIIADFYADMTKGSGAVKITPAHDFNDFEVGKRNNLESRNILNKDGTLNENVVSTYVGLTTAVARKKLLAELEEKELLEKAEDHLLSIPYGDRSNSVIEPFLAKQWFVNAEALAKDAIKVVQEGKIQFVPQNWENLYFEWMNNIQPWCISRQLWWGHRIPIYYATKNGETKVFVAESLTEAQALAHAHFGENVDITQDEDVLDTWFSSSLWTFLTMGWPENTEKLKRYYPSDVLITAFDIIFFWVARMIMMGVYLMKNVPFKKVYIHALIRDERGQKMSKSKGNVIDPLDIIAKYGTDALRFSLTAYSGQGRDIRLAEQTIEGYRNFVTKIWNSYKFCAQNGMVYRGDFNPQQVNLDINKWILYSLEDLQKQVDVAYESLKFNEVASHIYQFIWGTYCDWYIELSKPILYVEGESALKAETQQTMGFVFDAMLKILHSVMPFISQYLFENLHNNSKLVLAKETFPQLNFGFKEQDTQNTTKIVNLISKIRSIRVDLNISPALHLKLAFEGVLLPKYVQGNLEVIKKVARLEEITAQSKLSSDYIQDVLEGDVIGLPLGDVIDLTAERVRINKAIDKLQADVTKVESRLNNQQFMAKAEAEVVADVKRQHEELAEKIAKLSNLLNKIQV
ncbi:MAG: valine--tRNA ligase [Alphaproteobacteria bacterium]|jgi:valyl-tRNA synthetase|nr:valine--tRNA ligase [Alphaproteobacteria bacterium]